MKKLLLIVFVLSALNYSCSKKDHWTLGQGAPPLLIEYPVDLNFTVNPSCNIVYDPFSYGITVHFKFSAGSDSNLPNDTLGSHIKVFQDYTSYYSGVTYSVDDDKYYTVPEFDISANGQNDANHFIIQPADSGFNLFTRPFQNDTVSISGTCKAIGGNGKYSSIGQKISPLIFSGFMDTTNHTGSIRIKGSVYLQQ